MVTPHEEGTLIDFDYADLVDIETGLPLSPNTVERRRTGTVPFMALDVLHPSRKRRAEFPQHHFPRYDLESFIWVLVWTIHHYVPSTIPDLDSRRVWVKDAFDSDLSATTYAKTRSLKRQFIAQMTLSPKVGYDSTSALCMKLLQILREAYDAQDAVEDPKATDVVPSEWYYYMGGIFTPERIIKTVSDHLSAMTPVKKT